MLFHEDLKSDYLLSPRQPMGANGTAISGVLTFQWNKCLIGRTAQWLFFYQMVLVEGTILDEKVILWFLKYFIFLLNDEHFHYSTMQAFIAIYNYIFWENSINKLKLLISRENHNWIWFSHSESYFTYYLLIHSLCIN